MAQMFADMMKERSRRQYKFNDKMRALISDKLEKYQWSPEQIKGYCQANDIEMVSVEWIYRFIREDK
ncbi:MAG: IS30 family transposase, partial [Bacteroidota bacterium]